MAFDEVLAGRIRAALSFADGITEKRMFGGCGFLLDGHMVAAAGSGGVMLLRVDPARGPGLVNGSTVRLFRMNGREMAGWLGLEPEAVGSEADLRAWLDLALEFVRTLPPKDAAPPVSSR